MNKNYNKWFLTKVKQAIKDFHMIKKEDKVAVGLSGGKDSLSLLFILSLLQKYSHLEFQLAAITLNMGWDMDTIPLKAFCDHLEVPFYEEPTEIAQIVFDERKEKNPCALCGKLRRGALVNTAKKLGFNKVALGHHGDDAIETLLLNSTLGGNLSSFTPLINYLDSGITIIRPLIYLRERTIISLTQAEQFPVQPSPCPLDKHTKRQEMKDLVTEIENRISGSGNNLLVALRKQWLCK